MKRFAQLFTELDSTTSTNAKVDAMVRYLEEVGDEDKIWMIALLSGRRPPRAVNYRLLGSWASDIAGLPEWLFIESYHVVGDYAETIALLIPGTGESRSGRSLQEYMRMLAQLREVDDAQKKTLITTAWMELNPQERFIFNKMITGGMRVGVSQKLVMRALAIHTNQSENAIATRMMGKWDPASTDFTALVYGEDGDEDVSRPYPFYLAYALDIDPAELGKTEDWIVEHKWDGIRGQLIVRDKQLFIWTRGEELATDRYPELHPLRDILPSGTVFDGEILAYRDGGPMPFQDMQKRIGRKNLSKKVLQDIPVRMIVFDIIEWHRKDIRQMRQEERRTLLESIFEKYSLQGMLILSDRVQVSGWNTLDSIRLQARNFANEGLMLKHKDATYEVGRKRGMWWKWKTDPYSVDCVMIYAQRGHGRRANMFTDFTFAVWRTSAGSSDNELVPFAKAYSGLTDAEFEEITRWVNQNTIERFGPVSVVPPVHVFELHFEGIGRSPRHKSGIAVRFPRIHRWRKDKQASDADTLGHLLALIGHT